MPAKIKFDALPAQAEFFDDDTTGTLTLSAGLGCIKPDTLLATIDGEIPAADILSGQVYYSKNDQHQHSLYLGTAPYPKGKDYLYRVVHEHGEFEASGAHRIYVGNGRYQPLEEIYARRESCTSLHIPVPSTQDTDHVRSLLDDPSFYQRVVGFRDRYEWYTRLYGQLLRVARLNGQFYLPLPFDVHTIDRLIYDQKSLRTDDQVAQELGHNHLSELTVHHSTQDCNCQRVGLGEVEEYQGICAKCLERISQYTHDLSCRQSHEISSRRQKACESVVSFPQSSYSSPCSDTSKIITIERTQRQWFFDLHVFGSNNYYAAGCYHHNSGKTFVLCMKALKLSYLNRGYPGGFLCPSYPDFKKDVHPTFFEILENNKVYYRYHKTDKTFHFPWSKAPLYIFTAEKPIAGPNLAYCLINEFSLIQYDRINEMLRRVRVKNAPNKQKCMAGTPEDLFGWLESFVEAQKQAGDFKLMFADTSENIHIDDNYRAYLESILDEQALEVFASGKIVRIGGDYFYYSYKKESVEVDCNLIPSKLIHVGMDFNVGMMTASFSHKLYVGGREEQHFFDTILLKFESANTYDLCEAIIKKYCPDPRLMKDVKMLSGSNFKDKWLSIQKQERINALKNMLVTCDAAGVGRSTSSPRNMMSDVAILREYGFTVRYKAVNTRLRKRQLLVNGLMYHGRIKANPKTCRPLLNDWRNVRQKSENYEKVKDKDNKLTHFSDGADYVLDYEYKLPQEKNMRKIGVM